MKRKKAPRGVRKLSDLIMSDLADKSPHVYLNNLKAIANNKTLHQDVRRVARQMSERAVENQEP